MASVLTFEKTNDLMQLLEYKFPEDVFLVDQALTILNDIKIHKRICLYGLANTGKTKLLLLMHAILQYYNCPVIGLAYLNAHANSIQFKTFHSVFGIDWNTGEPKRFDKRLLQPDTFILIDDAMVASLLIYTKLQTFLSRKLKTHKVWANINMIVSAAIIPPNLWTASTASTCGVCALNDIKATHWLSGFHFMELQNNSNHIDISRLQMEPHLGFGRLNAGLIITWSNNRVKYFNTLCQAALKRTLPTTRTARTTRELIANIKKTSMPIINSMGICTTICDNEPIIITHSTKYLQKGWTGVYKHPHQIVRDSVILPIAMVRLTKELKVYPISLNYATTINRVYGEKFDKIQIDLCDTVNTSQVYLAINRTLKLQNINFIVRDHKILTDEDTD